ncbi:MAG: hypothetical protein Q9214_003480 [Letrouitia sp. 1 TL-2023]
MTQETSNMAAVPTFEEEIAEFLAMPAIGEETADFHARPTAQGEMMNTSNTPTVPAFRGEIADLAAVPMAGEGAAALAAPMPLRMTDYQSIMNQFGGGIDEIQLANWNEWISATSYEEILSLNRRYLCHLRTSTPYRLTRINSRTYPAVARFLRLHDLGMLTYRGEPPSSESFTEISSTNIPMYKETNRRPYLEFLLPRTIPQAVLTRFCCVLLRHSALFTMVYDRDGSLNTESVGQGNIPGTRIPIYRERSALRKDHLPRTTWGNFRYTFGREESNHRGRWHRWGCQAINQRHPLEFHILARDWNPPFDLFELIEFLARESGIGKNYQERNMFYPFETHVTWHALP